MKIPSELRECRSEDDGDGEDNFECKYGLVCKDSNCVCPENQIWIKNKCGI